MRMRMFNQIKTGKFETFLFLMLLKYFFYNNTNTQEINTTCAQYPNHNSVRDWGKIKYNKIII